jgi:hypothetical protein
MASYALLAFVLATQAAVAQMKTPLFQECPGVPVDYMPECWIAAHARIQVGGDRVFYCKWHPVLLSYTFAATGLQQLIDLLPGTPHTSKRWGNALSPYWQARALAQLAGHVSSFRARGLGVALR